MEETYTEFLEKYNKLRLKEKLNELTKKEADTLEYMQYKLDDWLSDGENSY